MPKCHFFKLFKRKILCLAIAANLKAVKSVDTRLLTDPETTFFPGITKRFCMRIGDEYDDVHTPYSVRVQGMFQTYWMFASYYDCNEKDPYSDKDQYLCNTFVSKEKLKDGRSHYRYYCVLSCGKNL